MTLFNCESCKFKTESAAEATEHCEETGHTVDSEDAGIFDDMYDEDHAER